MDAHARTGAHRGHGRALGEELRVRADADLEVLRPHALGDQDLLDPRRLGRAGLHPAQVRAHGRLDLPARPLGQRRVAPGPLLDHALQQARHERDAAGLHRLQVRGGQQPRAARVPRALHAVAGQRLQRTDRGRGLERGAHLRGRGLVQQAARGRPAAGEIDDLVAAHRHHRGAVLGGQPGAADQERVGRLARQAVAGGETGRGAHARASYVAATSAGTRRSGWRAVPVMYWLVT